MPRMPRNAEDIEAVKMKILEAAKVIIGQEGFNQFSMRRLAASLGMTATNIYNYYASKDAIYLGVQTAGFAMLLEKFQHIALNNHLPNQRLEGFVRAYIDFGFKHPDYYEVMLGSNTPKYADYVGSDMEAVAADEKQTAMEVARMVMTELMKAAVISEQEALYRTTQAWVTLHGLVSLRNNRVLQELELDLDRTVERICQELLLPLTP